MASFSTLQQGELAYWLQVVADNAKPDTAPVQVPPLLVEALATLRCITVAGDGRCVMTDKGWLALRMLEPGALNLD